MTGNQPISIKSYLLYQRILLAIIISIWLLPILATFFLNVEYFDAISLFLFSIDRKLALVIIIMTLALLIFVFLKYSNNPFAVMIFSLAVGFDCLLTVSTMRAIFSEPFLFSKKIVPFGKYVSELFSRMIFDSFFTVDISHSKMSWMKIIQCCVNLFPFIVYIVNFMLLMISHKIFLIHSPKNTNLKNLEKAFIPSYIFYLILLVFIEVIVYRSWI
jgi:hypothetical protein